MPLKFFNCLPWLVKRDKKQNAINDFYAIASLLEKVLSKIDDQTDIIYTHFEEADDLIKHITKLIGKLKAFDYDPLDTVNIDFAPTGLYQELSMQNNWSDEYLRMAREFDKIYDRLIKKKS
ncbi:hypothetical protein IM792_11080 [Mucilaginibacter sp. JRF]|uniref:hypothetical protein n=1 Tax=Mucilaginibacter sp. JRF TaxID=2780088 RepID=UPI00188281C4|nr:hypothetical protein [Mucilaginibacter sp. JRF]MBE9584992.1 hypothetical protein [Mucilaginibacter sp. JRF]